MHDHRENIQPFPASPACQEINIISPTEGVFDWVLGAYYQRNDINVRILEEQAGFPTDILPHNKLEHD